MPNSPEVSRHELEELLVTLLQQLGQSCQTEKARNIMGRAVRELPRSGDLSSRPRVVHLLKFQLWKRKYHPKQWAYLEGRPSKVAGRGRRTAKITRAIDAIDSSLGWKKLAPAADEVPAIAAYSVLIGVLIELVINIVGAAIYDLTKYGVKKIRRRPSRIYSEPELIKHAQRLLAIRLSLHFHQLAFKSIESGSSADVEAEFRVRDGDLYRVSMAMIGGIPIITRLRHEKADTNRVPIDGSLLPALSP